jgi:hypothetical protein
MRTMWGVCTKILIASLTLFFGVILRSQDHAANEDLRSRLTGAWRLVWMEDQGADGKVHRFERMGMLDFSRDGHMSVQIMARNPSELPAAEATKYYQGGYAAYYGRYELNERARTITYHVEGALVQTLIGTDLIRKYEFQGSQLVIKPVRPDEHWVFAWERY